FFWVAGLEAVAVLDDLGVVPLDVACFFGRAGGDGVACSDPSSGLAASSGGGLLVSEFGLRFVQGALLAAAAEGAPGLTVTFLPLPAFVSTTRVSPCFLGGPVNTTTGSPSCKSCSRLVLPLVARRLDRNTE